MEKITTTNLPQPEEEEIWETHPVYTEYEVSTFGNVRRKKNKYMMTPSINGRGYLIVHLRAGVEDSHGKYVRIHRLVAETFLDKPADPKYEVDHLDRNRVNNYYKNLRWVSRKENLANSSPKRQAKIYMDRPAIVLLDKNTNNLIREFKNLAEASEITGASPAGIKDNIHGYKYPYRFGYFMLKSDYLKKSEEKI